MVRPLRTLQRRLACVFVWWSELLKLKRDAFGRGGVSFFPHGVMFLLSTCWVPFPPIRVVLCLPRSAVIGRTGSAMYLLGTSVVMYEYYKNWLYYY